MEKIPQREPLSIRECEALKVPKWFKEYLENTRDNDRAKDESQKFQHQLDYATFLDICPTDIYSLLHK